MALIPQLVIFGKWPRAGQVKSRLAHDIGTSGAVQFYRTNLFATVRRLSADARWHTRLALADGRDAARTQSLFHSIEVTGQGRGDLGARMARQFLRSPPGPLVLIGSDIPDIGADDIAQAFSLLGSHDAVFGPAPDGGYWLVGMKRRPHIINPFENVRWSTSHAQADTLANLPSARIAMLDERADIDEGADLRAYRSERRGRISTKLQG